ncbi:MAG: Hsp70 family protein [Acidobacteriota bacterium]
MKSAPIVGIDLGTTNSEVAFVFDKQPSVLELGDDGIVPSCVGVDGKGGILVGAAARNQQVLAPERTVVSIKRKIGSGQRVSMGAETYSPREISAFILKALKDRAEKALGRPVSKAVITVPAYFTDAQRQATREAGEIAGLEVVRILNEPTAAALAYEKGSPGKRTILVYDLGGGTFDVSVVSLESGVVEVLASTGDHQLGGDDFDDRIVEKLNRHIEEELGVKVGEDRALQARLRRAAEAAKIQLSSRPQAQIREDHIAQVQGRPQHLVFELSRFQFEEMIEESLSRTMEAVSRALNDAKVTPGQLDKILLVGGSTRIPRIAEMLRERLGKEPHGEVDPELCVALGAALQAGIEMGVEVETVLVDVTPYTFGTSAVGELDGKSYPHEFVPLIRRNSKLPATQTKLFHTIWPDQESVAVRVYQGESRDALKNVRIGNFLFKGLNEIPEAHDRGILVTYRLNLDGILEVQALERASGKAIRAVVEDALARATPRELEASQSRVAVLWQDSKNGLQTEAAGNGNGGPPAGYQDTFERANTILASAPKEDRDEIVDLMERIGEATREGRWAEAAQSHQQLEEILFYLDAN